MHDYEIFLKKGLELKNAHNFVNYMPIDMESRAEMRNIVKKLEEMGLIKNIRYMSKDEAVGFDITYEGCHYFDEK